MGGADRIHVQAFHRLDVLFHLLGVDGAAVHRAEIMTVHTVEHHALAIDNQRTVGTDAHFAEAHLTATDVNGLSACIFQSQYKVIEIRGLGTPFFRIVHVHVQTQFTCAAYRLACLCDDTAVILDADIHTAAFHAFCA